MISTACRDLLFLNLKNIEMNDRICIVIRLTDISGIDHMKYNEFTSRPSGQFARDSGLIFIGGIHYEYN